MNTANPQNMMTTAISSRPYRGAKAHDICRVAQRIFDDKGVVLVSEVFKKARTRIPGNLERYRATLVHLATTNQLKSRKKAQ